MTNRTEREQFTRNVQSQGYSRPQAERVAALAYPETTAERRTAGLVKARAARKAKAQLDEMDSENDLR